ncbi:MAG: hypothetical protein U0Q22_17090 [Acidimicrobiales bacterium]
MKPARDDRDGGGEGHGDEGRRGGEVTARDPVCGPVDGPVCAALDGYGAPHTGAGIASIQQLARLTEAGRPRGVRRHTRVIEDDARGTPTPAATAARGEHVSSVAGVAVAVTPATNVAHHAAATTMPKDVKASRREAAARTRRRPAPSRRA